MISGSSGASLYDSPIPDTMNVRFTENHIIIDRPAQEVFDWVTTWVNVPMWLPVATGVAVLHGDASKPSKLGDIVIERIDPSTTDGIDKLYTVVAQIDGLLQTVAGGEFVSGDSVDRIQYISTFAVKPISDREALLTRIFQTIRRGAENPAERAAVEDPQAMQRGMEHLKQVLEASVPSVD